MAFIKIAEGELLLNDIPANEALADVEITNRFIKLAEKLKKIAPKSDQFLYFTAIFMHGAEAALIDPKTGEPKKDRAGKEITGGFADDWRWGCSDSTIDPYSNQNGDIFPSSELKKAHEKWRGRPLCVNHESSNVEGVRGIIIDTHWDDKYKRVVGLCALDKQSYPDLAFKVKSGYANNVSMGTAVGRALCTVCLTAAVTEKDYCNCVRSKKGQRINGVRVGEINLDLNPIELSLVVTPADQQAKVLRIIASMNNYVDQRNLLLEDKDRVETDKIAKLDSSIKNVEGTLNRLFAECSDSSCQFVRGSDGHMKLVKSAQEQLISSADSAMWSDYFNLAKQVDSSEDSSDKANLLGKMDKLRSTLNVKDLRGNEGAFLEAVNLTDPELKRKQLSPLITEYNVLNFGAQPSMQDNQFTSPNGPDKDLGLDSGSTTTMPANEQQTGDRMSKIVNPSETSIKPDKGGDLGPELGSASDRFQFGNMASLKDLILMTKEGKTADIDENLSLLLKQTQEIEAEMGKMRQSINLDNNVAVNNNNAATMEDMKMNEARLKLRAAQRQALLGKEGGKKTAYWQGTEEPKPGTAQYKPDNGGEPKIRMNDKQMKQDGKMGGPEGVVPGDEAEKKKLLRADLEQRALNRRAWWLGTEEPKPGKQQYKVDPLGQKARNDLDKQMNQDKSMGGAEGSFPGDEADKKKLLRAELVPGILRTKFTKVRNADGSYNKKASYFEIYSGENKLLKATADEIYGDELNKPVEGTDGKTAWDVLASREYGMEVMAAIRNDGFKKVAYLLKGGQATMPEMPAPMDMSAMEAPAEKALPPANDEGADKKEINVNEVVSLLSDVEDKLSDIKTTITGEDPDAVKDVSVETTDDATEAVGAELTAQVVNFGREIHAELDSSADELALLVGYLNKSASLSATKKIELNKLASEAIEDSKSLLEEADTILAVAGKIPAGLKAFQDKQKDKKKDKGDDKDDKKKDKKDEKSAKDKDDKKKDKKDDKDDKKKDKGDKDKKKDKKEKKAEVIEALMKLAQELDGDADDKEMDAMMAEMGDEKAAEECGMCGLAMDNEHACTASAKEQLVVEALANRKMKREAFLKAAEDKKYDVVSDTHGLLGEAHKGSETNTTTQLDVKPAGDGAVVEGLDKVHDAMLGAANAVPTGKQGSSSLASKEAEIKFALAADMKTKKDEDDKNKFRVRLRRAYDLGLQMQEKGMVPRTKESLDSQVDEIMKFDDLAFESYKRVIANTQSTVKTASRNVPTAGVREDNSQPGDNGTESVSLTDSLKSMW